MKLIGDVHGLFYDWKCIVEKLYEPSLVLGDFGIFDKRDIERINGFGLSENHKFFRGNHDNPSLCHSMPIHLGDYGVFDHKGQTVFYLAGGDSIDKEYRIPGMSWWEDEQLSMQRLQSAIDLWCEKKPDIMLSHDPAESIKGAVSLFRYKCPSRTGQALQAMLDFHLPKLVVFAHMHVSHDETHNENYRVVGLDELQVFDLDKAIKEFK